MKNWKTTLSGALAAVSTFLATSPNATLQTIGQVGQILFTFLMGASAKDHNVTGV